MGAHEIPLDYRDRREDYVRLVIDEMIPAVAAEGLAEWCDVFCETGVFTPGGIDADSRRPAPARGLKPGSTPTSSGASGGSQVAAAVGARSADHLDLRAGQPASARLARRGTSSRRCCRIAAFYLKLGPIRAGAGADRRRCAGGARDRRQPGGGFSPSMPFAMTLACFAMGLTFEEALAAATINGAYSLDRARLVGSLEPGKLMDAVLVARRCDRIDPGRRAVDRRRHQARNAGIPFLGTSHRGLRTLT